MSDAGKKTVLQVADILAEQGLDVSVFEDTFFRKAIETRCATLGNLPFADYCGLLRSDPAELAQVTGSLRIGYSEFFRSPLTFACLEALILPAIIKRKAKSMDGGLRIWSAACSEGQEAYSIAILCDELLQHVESAPAYQIFGTDIDQVALQTARTGTYDEQALGRITLKRSQACFTRHGASYTVVQRIQDAVDFSTFDLVTEKGMCPPISIFGSFDLVFCCNMLFYYKPRVQHHIIEKISSCLAPGSYLVTGEAEREIVARHHFREVFPGSAIFKPEHEGGLTH